MKTEMAGWGGNRCPACGARTSVDLAGRGWVRHLESKGPCPGVGSAGQVTATRRSSADVIAESKQLFQVTEALGRESDRRWRQIAVLAGHADQIERELLRPAGRGEA